ncbi:DUF397 domain-containing protein [Streptomyces sp. NPDC059477]|uniref:DUF397 domain-containing protein n=1 Tax=Streptomyces sp. NPDC059477 TaxID=3346847 RepID=UPI00368F3405
MKPTRKPDLRSAAWRKSSFSEEYGADCVEVATNFPSVTPVRDSKAPEGPTLLLSTNAWAAFVTAVKA